MYLMATCFIFAAQTKGARPPCAGGLGGVSGVRQWGGRGPPAAVRRLRRQLPHLLPHPLPPGGPQGRLEVPQVSGSGEITAHLIRRGGGWAGTMWVESCFKYTWVARVFEAKPLAREGGPSKHEVNSGAAREI